jgi:hypothetical protein
MHTKPRIKMYCRSRRNCMLKKFDSQGEYTTIDVLGCGSISLAVAEGSFLARVNMAAQQMWCMSVLITSIKRYWINTSSSQLGRLVSPFLQATKALRESRGIALLCFQTSALERGEGSASRSGRFLTPGNTRYPLYRRLGGPQGRSGQVQNISQVVNYNNKNSPTW